MTTLKTRGPYLIGNLAPGTEVRLMGIDIQLIILVDRAQCPELSRTYGATGLTVLCVEPLIWELRRVHIHTEVMEIVKDD